MLEQQYYNIAGVLFTHMQVMVLVSKRCYLEITGQRHAQNDSPTSLLPSVVKTLQDGSSSAYAALVRDTVLDDDDYMASPMHVVLLLQKHA